MVRVAKELDFAKTYSGLLKISFENSIIFDFAVQNNHLTGYVVSLSLQLLLENCVKHNLATESQPLKIKIYTGNNTLIIENNIQTRELANNSTGVGLFNIVAIIKLLTSNPVLLEKSNEIFKIILPILKEKSIKINHDYTQNDLLVYEMAVKRVEELKGFCGNLISYCVFIPLLIFINLANTLNLLWFQWPMIGRGIGIGAHALKVYGIGKNWEEK